MLILKALSVLEETRALYQLPSNWWSGMLVWKSGVASYLPSTQTRFNPLSGFCLSTVLAPFFVPLMIKKLNEKTQPETALTPQTVNNMTQGGEAGFHEETAGSRWA